MEEWEQQLYGYSDVDPEDSFSFTTSNNLPPLFNDVLDYSRLSYDSELNDFGPTLKAVQHDIHPLASLEITTGENSASDAIPVLKPDILFNAEQNWTQSHEIPQNDGNEGADDSFNISDFSPLTESQCLQMWELIGELNALELVSPPKHDNTYERNEETNQMTIEEEQNVVATEPSVEEISPEPQQTVISYAYATCPPNSSLNNQIPVKEAPDTSEGPTPGPSTSTHNQSANVDKHRMSPKKPGPGRRSLKETHKLTEEQYKERRRTQNREAQQRKRDRQLIRRRLASNPITLPSNLSPESRSRIINETKHTILRILLEKLRDRNFYGSYEKHVQFLIDLVEELPFIQS